MFDIQLLLNKNLSDVKHKVRMLNGKYVYTMYNSVLDLKAIWRFIQFVNSLKVKLPIIIELKNVRPEDKLCYILLECFCYHLISARNMKISITLKVKSNIFIAGIALSPLKILSSSNPPQKYEAYMKKFTNEIHERHYRRLITTDENQDGVAASKISSEIEIFLRTFRIEQEYIDDVTEVIGELIDNGLEHSDADCLIDVDVTLNYVKDGDPDGIYYGVNIVIVNFSDVLIGDKIKQIYDQIQNDWYDKLRSAYNNHSKFWDDNYTINDFFTMAAFQNGISGRSLTSNTGGTGLTQLISALESKSDAYNCYVISGNRILRFQQELLKQDSFGWVGFNSEHDFINKPPQKNNLVKSPISFPGVAYNLNFVLKKEQKNE